MAKANKKWWLDVAPEAKEPNPPKPEDNVLIRFDNVHTYFRGEAGIVKAVNGVSFEIRRGETVCVVGESGCGKSVTSLSLMRLVEEPQGKIVSGHIWFDGIDMVQATKKDMYGYRGNRMSMIFQEPMTSLNPALKIGYQVGEVLRKHKGKSKQEAKEISIQLLDQVGIPRADEIVDSYPHELSGGMRQRAMIAMALACEPELLIADEPTTALDVTIQAQILEELQKIKENTNTAILFITHDLGVVAEIADYVVVMYAGKVVEQGTVMQVFTDPKHPYTKGLMKAKPIIGEKQERLFTIPGQVPNPIDLGEGCYFADRCPNAMDICRKETPPVFRKKGHQVSCWLYEKGAEHDEQETPAQ